MRQSNFLSQQISFKFLTKKGLVHQDYEIKNIVHHAYVYEKTVIYLHHDPYRVDTEKSRHLVYVHTLITREGMRHAKVRNHLNCFLLTQFRQLNKLSFCSFDVVIDTLRK